MLGASLVYLPDRAPATILETCQRHEITHVLSVPLMWNNLAAKITANVRAASWFRRTLFASLCSLSLGIQRLFPIWGQKFAYHTLFRSIHEKIWGSKLHCALSGGAAIAPKTLKLLNAIGVPLVNGLGMTETGIIAIDPGTGLSRRLHATVGKPLSTIEMKLVPMEGQKNGVGELYLRGHSLHTGRLQKGQWTPPDRDKDGWFATGDLGWLGKDGYLYLKGRCKDTIIPSTGEKVFPDEVEQSFRELEGWEEFCVVGIRNPDNSEDVTLVLRLKKEYERDSFRPELAMRIEKINRTLPISKRVTRVLLSQSPLPTTTSMKTQRIKLKNLVEQNDWPVVSLDLNGHRTSALSQTNDTSLACVPADEGQKIREEIRAIFARVLDKPVSSIREDSHFMTELGGDSLQAIQLAAELEKHYHLLISDTLLSQCANVKEMATAVWELLHRGEKVREGRIATAQTPSERLPVTRFEESREYQMFLKRIQQAGEFNPYFVAHDSVVRDTSRVAGREMLNFASYNYLGLSGHPETMRLAQEAIQKYGTSASGSRLITGEKSLYRELEQKLAAWKHVEDAVVLVSGHATNVTFVGNFCNENDLILYDSLSHNSIEQGCRLSRSDSKAFPHNDFSALDNLLKTRRPFYEKILVVVEGVYSMDGDIAPIPDFVALKRKYGTFLMVDEAHSTCVLGKTGRGVDEHFGLAPEDIDIRMGTLSKGLGSCGGYLAGHRSLIEYLRYSLPGFVFSVGIPPASAASALAALELVERDHSMIARLHANIEMFLDEAHRRNFHTCLAQKTAILPILVGDDKAAFVVSRRLKERDVFVVPAVYPAVARGQARLRFCVTSEHKPSQIVYAMDTLHEAAMQENIAMPAYNSKVATA
jgi:8-amino-7-oxononanoate synthase/acyl carrier protein